MAAVSEGGRSDALRHLHPFTDARELQKTGSRVFVRGDPTRRGDAVPRRFLSVLAGPDPAPFRKGSGRRAGSARVGER